MAANPCDNRLGEDLASSKVENVFGGICHSNKMKYLLVLIIVLAVWGLVDQFLRKDRSSEGTGSFFDELKDLGRNLHVMMGILAVIIVILFVARLIYQSLQSP